MHDLVQSLVQLLTSLGDLVIALAAILVPLIPLAVWIAFWMFGVNWVKLRSVLLQGGWIGLVLLGFLAVLIWGTVAPPPSGAHHFLGLTLGNFVGKTVLVTTLICVMFLCGSVQLSGACGSLCQFEEPAPEIGFHGPGDHGAGHGGDAGHGESHEHGDAHHH